ncbi:hypothetical protein [Actinomadura sp. HBU206391]|uniref:hypothetical protein n=1 Tax=Actinomadura sp. HBU206391 TaxID=2731692 RepID=UPI00164EEEE7|nr:hypothetical protein [Actinomadura sp. HBU206391]MBC6459411.1 hypothetical protein [Actinomadura sp. HBU206391]
MIVCYAQGGGLGHLTRIRAFLHTTRRRERVTILTGSPFAADARVVGGHEVLSAPAGMDRDGLSRWIGAALADLAPRELLVDAFPAGLSGELHSGVAPAGTRMVHLARLLRWDAYRRLLPAAPPRFDQTWTVEPLTRAHHAYLGSVSSALAPLELAEPPADAVPPSPGGWLIVHTGPAAEVLDLVEYARESAAAENARPRFTLVSPQRPAGLPAEVAHLDVYPAWPLFPESERIITAAGCNAVRQLAPWRSRHRMVPFPRRFDDQFARAARHRRLR